MKTLINDSFKALRTGDYVKADIDAGEFILDTNVDDPSITKAALTEVANANDIKISGKTKAEILDSLEVGLEAMNLPEMNKMGDSEKVLEIVTAGVEADLDDDTMLIKIVQSGIKFSAANKMFKAAMETGGFRTAMSKVKELAREILVGAEFNPESHSDVSEMVGNLVLEINGSDEKQALKAVKAYCKEFEIELPKAKKEPKGPMLERVQNWIVANPLATVTDLTKWLEDQGKNEKLVARYSQLLEFAQNYVVARENVEVSEVEDCDAEAA